MFKSINKKFLKQNSEHNQSEPQALDISIDNEFVSISRNYEGVLRIPHKNNKNLVALLDAMLNPDKYDIQVHDLRTVNVWSRLSFEKEAKTTLNDMPKEERRFFERIDTDLDCSIIIDNKDYKAEILDISENGLKAKFRDKFPKGLCKNKKAMFSFVDKLIGNKQIIVQDEGAIVRVNPEKKEMALIIRSDDYEEYVCQKKAKLFSDDLAEKRGLMRA